jgi:hypothetical protein
MKIPVKKPLIKGGIADYYYDEKGILYSYSKSELRTVKNISENIALVKQITGGKVVPLLIYLSDSPVPSKETRNFSREQLPSVYKAMAMVSQGGLPHLLMGILFKFKPPPIPIKTFTDDKKALIWLQQFL